MKKIDISKISSLKYIFWFPNDIIDNKYINNIKKLKIEKHYGNMIKTEIYLKKYKLEYEIINDYFSGYENKYKPILFF